jgi:hypothetical protein
LVFTENVLPNGGEYLLENYISFLTDSNLPLNRKIFTIFKNIAFKSYTEWRVNIRKTFTKIKYSQIINTFYKIWRTNEIIYSTCIPASKLENYISFLTDSNLPLNRKNIDKGKNKFGKLLINLCKGQNLFNIFI